MNLSFAPCLLQLVLLICMTLLHRICAIGSDQHGLDGGVPHGVGFVGAETLRVLDHKCERQQLARDPSAGDGDLGSNVSLLV